MKNKLTTVHYIIIILIIFSGILVYSYKYNYDKFFREYLDCSFITDEENYKETFTIIYNKNNMLEYTRKEIVYTKNKKSFIETFNKMKKEYEENNINCEYTIEEKEDSVVITTKIDVLNNKSLFNRYLKDENINNEMDAKTIKNVLSDKFICKIRTEA